MNSLTKTSITLLLIILTSLPSIASESLRPVSVMPARDRYPSPSPVVRRETLNASDLEKYRMMSEKSRSLAMREAAGASSTTKTVLIVVGVVVVVLVVVAVGSSYSNLGNISYGNPG